MSIELSDSVFSVSSSSSKIKIPFECKICGLSEEASRFDRLPPSSARRSLIFKTQTFSIPDPFTSSPDSPNFLALGSLCSDCSIQVCLDINCSLFYQKNFFCLPCVRKNPSRFPDRVLAKAKKKT